MKLDLLSSLSSVGDGRPKCGGALVVDARAPSRWPARWPEIHLHAANDELAVAKRRKTPGLMGTGAVPINRFYILGGVRYGIARQAADPWSNG